MNSTRKGEKDVIVKALEEKGVELVGPDFYLAIWNYEYENEMTDYYSRASMMMSTTSAKYWTTR